MIQVEISSKINALYDPKLDVPPALMSPNV
jgi:hypothetical protein